VLLAYARSASQAGERPGVWTGAFVIGSNFYANEEEDDELFIIVTGFAP
jgi:hypothetical protein